MSRKFNGKACQQAVELLADMAHDGLDEEAIAAIDRITSDLEILHAMAVERNDVLEAMRSEIPCYENLSVGEYVMMDDIVDYYHHYTNDDGVLEPVDDLML